MIIAFSNRAIMRRNTAFMVKGEEVEVKIVHGTRGGFLYVTVEDNTGQCDYVASEFVKFKPVSAKEGNREIEPQGVTY